MSEPMPDAETLSVASMVAHQLKSPVAATASLLEALACEGAGPLTPKQKDLLDRALGRCQQAAESARRTMTLVRAVRQGRPQGASADLAALARRTEEEFAQRAAEQDISYSVQIQPADAVVAADADALWEVLAALLDNAFKYTPDHGHVRLVVAPAERAGAVRFSVADSGVGLGADDAERVFQPFYRTAAASDSTRGGSGLGLSLVHAAITACGGQITAGRADLGGAEFTVELPAAAAEDATETESTAPPLRVVIVGGVAAGPKAASKIIRLQPRAQVTVVEKGKFLSYAGCGLPYYLSGEVADYGELMSTPVGAVRDPVFFQNVKNVRTLSSAEAVAIDRDNRRVQVRHDDRTSWLPYDKLVLATGAQPVAPPFEGAGLSGVFGLHGLRDAEGIRAALAGRAARDVVIIGGGLLGVEATEAIVSEGGRVTIVELREQILGLLDPEIAALVEHHLNSHGVKVLTDTCVQRLEGDAAGRVCRVVTDRGDLPAELVIPAMGVRPNVELARRAGLALGPTGAIAVDARMQTSDERIYAAGDCCEHHHRLTGRPVYAPMGSTANKQARCAAVNLCGGQEAFPGVLATAVCKVFDYCVARTGLTEAEARQGGYDVVTVLAPAPDRAHYMSHARPLYLKLVVDRATRKLLGAQATGPGAGDKRIDVAVMAISAGMTVDDLANADLAYAPPYAPAMDNIITAANVARNKLAGLFAGVSPAALKRRLDAGEDLYLLDVRSPREHQRQRLAGAHLVPLGALRGRMDVLPRGKPIVAFCNISLRGYEAALLLRANGFDNVEVLDGGLDMWPYEKVF